MYFSSEPVALYIAWLFYVILSITKSLDHDYNFNITIYYVNKKSH
jgi:hypothetical protein